MEKCGYAPSALAGFILNFYIICDYLFRIPGIGYYEIALFPEGRNIAGFIKTVTEFLPEKTRSDGLIIVNELR